MERLSGSINASRTGGNRVGEEFFRHDLESQPTPRHMKQDRPCLVNKLHVRERFTVTMIGEVVNQAEAATWTVVSELLISFISMSYILINQSQNH